MERDRGGQPDIEIDEQVRLWRERLSSPDEELLRVSKYMLEVYLELFNQLGAEAVQDD